MTIEKYILKYKNYEYILKTKIKIITNYISMKVILPLLAKKKTVYLPDISFTFITRIILSFLLIEKFINKKKR